MSKRSIPPRQISHTTPSPPDSDPINSDVSHDPEASCHNATSMAIRPLYLCSFSHVRRFVVGSSPSFVAGGRSFPRSSCPTLYAVSTNPTVVWTIGRFGDDNGVPASITHHGMITATHPNTTPVNQQRSPSYLTGLTLWPKRMVESAPVTCRRAWYLSQIPPAPSDMRERKIEAKIPKGSRMPQLRSIRPP
jgi:hypothetical protein